MTSVEAAQEAREIQRLAMAEAESTFYRLSGNPPFTHRDSKVSARPRSIGALHYGGINDEEFMTVYELGALSAIRRVPSCAVQCYLCYSRGEKITKTVWNLAFNN